MYHNDESIENDKENFELQTKPTDGFVIALIALLIYYIFRQYMGLWEAQIITLSITIFMSLFWIFRQLSKNSWFWILITILSGVQLFLLLVDNSNKKIAGSTFAGLLFFDLIICVFIMSVAAARMGSRQP